MWLDGVAISPDSSRIAVGVNGPTSLYQWYLETGQPVALPVKTAPDVIALAYGPAARVIATGHLDGGVRLWDASTHVEIGTAREHPGTAMGLAFSADGTMLAVSCGDGTTRLWDVTSGEIIDLPVPKRGFPEEVAFSPDDRYLAIASDEEVTRVWHAKRDPRLLRTLDTQSTSIEDAALDSTGRYMAFTGDQLLLYRLDTW
jgi:WD40 repeat protein